MREESHDCVWPSGIPELFRGHKRHELLARLLTEAVERGELAALDILYTADAMLAAFQPALYRFQRQERGFSSERILQGLCHIYIDGVKAPSAPAGRADEQPTV